MEEIRLVGIAQGGDHLEFIGPDEVHVVAPVDDALRQAVQQVVLRRAAAAPDRGDRSDAMTPRQVQAIIRAGADTAEAARISGWTEEKVTRFETPILAERAHISRIARGTVLRGRASDGSVATLDQRVSERLAHRGVPSDDLSWDARRADGAPWTVLLTFRAGGRQREASWHFDIRDHSLEALDDEARWLSEDEQHSDTLLGARTVTPSSRRVYDVEAEGGFDRHEDLQELSAHHPALREARARSRAERAHPAQETPQGSEEHEVAPIDLVSAIRERSTARQRRRPGKRQSTPTHQPPAARTPDVVEPDYSEPELPLEGMPEVGDEPQHEAADDVVDTVQPEDLAEGFEETAGFEETEGFEDNPPLEPDSEVGLADLEAPVEDAGDDNADYGVADDTDYGVAEEDLEPQRSGTEVLEDIFAERNPEPETNPAADEHAEPELAPARKPKSSRRAKGRPSVPSWDDIMFGAKDDRS